MFLRPKTMNEVVRTTSGADWRRQRWNTVADTRAFHDTCSGYHIHHIDASANTGKLEHNSETVERGACRATASPKHRSTNNLRPTDLDCAFGCVACTVRNEDARTHTSQYANACTDVMERKSVTIRDDQTHALRIFTRAI